MTHGINRRTFLQTTTAAGIGTAIFPSTIARRYTEDSIRMGLIGVGLRGRNHLNILLRRNDVEVVAICDLDEDALAKSQAMITEAGKPKAKEYTGDDHAYRELLADDSISGVIIATPWLWHTRMAVDTMRSGKYAGVEVSAANTLEECWDLVNTYEATGKPCMILEFSSLICN